MERAFLTARSVSVVSLLAISSGGLTPLCLEYHSWNAGPRSCLGRALATYEGVTISTAILQHFDVVLADDSRPYEPLAALNMVWTIY